MPYAQGEEDIGKSTYLPTLVVVYAGQCLILQHSACFCRTVLHDSAPSREFRHSKVNSESNIYYSSDVQRFLLTMSTPRTMPNHQKEIIGHSRSWDTNHALLFAWHTGVFFPFSCHSIDLHERQRRRGLSLIHKLHGCVWGYMQA